MSHLLLTGGGGAIGSAIKVLFASRGFQVTSPNSRELDLSQDWALQNYAKTLQIPFDVFIYCAGINRPKPIEDQTLEDLERTLAVNCRGFFCIAQKVAETMKKRHRGAILAVSSLYGSIARKGRLPYVASKHALNGMVKTMALEWGPFNIKVNSLSPGFVDTPMTRRNNAPEVIRSFEQRIPFGRLANPEEITRAAFFLCSDENTYITGQDIVADGGYSVGGFEP